MNRKQITAANGLVAHKEYRNSKPRPARVLDTTTLWHAYYGFDSVRYNATSDSRCKDGVRDVTGYLTLTVSTFYTTADQQAEAAAWIDGFTGTTADLLKYGRRIDGALPLGVCLTITNSRDLSAR